MEMKREPTPHELEAATHAAPRWVVGALLALVGLLIAWFLSRP